MKPYQPCPRCHASVDDHLTHCPVCGCFIKDQTKEFKTKRYPEPSYRKIATHKNKQAFFIFFSLTLLTLFLLTFLNFAIPSWPFTWTFVIITLLLYSWVLVTNTILSQVTIGAKLLWQSTALSLTLTAFNLAISPQQWWFVSFALPLILFGVMISLLMIILFSQRQPRDDYRFLILFIILNFTYTILSFLEINHMNHWMGYLTFSAGLLTIIGIMTLGRKGFIRFIKSWFHI